jgi:hypothetical protein
MVFPPHPFIWSASIDDFFLELGLIFVIVAMLVVFIIQLILRGKWGKIFFHSERLQTGIEFQHEGGLDVFTMKDFGALKTIKMGPKEGQIVIPRQGGTFKGPESPILSIILGRGIGVAINPFLAEYVRRMGGAWPEWSGAKPPKSAKDLPAFYLMYAEWKAQGEHKEESTIDEYVAKHLHDVDPSDAIVMDDVRMREWVEDRKDKLATIFGEYKGSFSAMVEDLKDPEVATVLKNAINEFLNSCIQSEPAELWPTWIAGHMVDARDLARWAEPITSSEVTSMIASVKMALMSDLKTLGIRILLYVFAFLGMCVGAVILIKGLGL